jgi:hypothetical protein
MEVVEGVCMLVLMCQLGQWEAEMLRSGRVGVFDPETLIQIGHRKVMAELAEEACRLI